MRKLLAFVILVFAFASPQDSWADKTYHVVVFADSIAGGYQLQPQDAFPARLERRIRAAGYDQVEMFNISDNNGTTASATTKVDEVISKLPDVIIVQLGFNDAKLGVVPEATRTNLNSILFALKKTGAYIIMAGTPAPDGVADSYKDVVEENYRVVAGAAGVPLVPNIIEGVANNASLTLADGRHPNTVGVETMVENIFPFVDVGLRWRYDVYMHEIAESQKTKPPGLPSIQ